MRSALLTIDVNRSILLREAAQGNTHGSAVKSVNRDELVAQLIRLVDVRLLDPLEILVDAVGTPSTVDAVRGLVRTRASSWARDLLGADDMRAEYTATRLVMALYPSDGPFDPPPEWWPTPLGQVFLRRVGYPGGDAVPYSVAGVMLGVSRQFVHDLATRGKLERHPDGGVHVDSVRARLTGRSPVRPQPGSRDIPPPDDDDVLPASEVGGPPAEPEP
jgi:hypothetical protein